MRTCAAADCDRELNSYRSGPRSHCHSGRGLCARCHLRAANNGTLLDYPRVTRSRDDLLDDWVVLRQRGMNKSEAAAHLGVSLAAFKKAYERARAAGDPRARVMA